MAGSIFKRDVRNETGISWEDWIRKLDDEVDSSWSNERIAEYLSDAYGLEPKWSETIALLYGQKLGRTPTGQTASAGVQIGVRRTMPVSKEQAWNFLLSPEGLKLWIGELSSLPLQPGQHYKSKDGAFGEMRVVIPFEKLRMTWQLPEWDNPSTLQIYVLSNRSGRTTVSFHQEKLDDIYMREMMKRRWEDVLTKMEERLV